MWLESDHAGHKLVPYVLVRASLGGSEVGIGACHTSPGGCREGRSLGLPEGRASPPPAISLPREGRARGPRQRRGGEQQRGAAPGDSGELPAPGLRGAAVPRSGRWDCSARPSLSCSFPRPHPCGAGRDGLPRTPGSVAAAPPGSPRSTEQTPCPPQERGNAGFGAGRPGAPPPRACQLRLPPPGRAGPGPALLPKPSCERSRLCATETPQHLNCAFPYSEPYPLIGCWAGTHLKVLTGFFLQFSPRVSNEYLITVSAKTKKKIALELWSLLFSLNISVFFYRIRVNSFLLSFSTGLLSLSCAKKPMQPPQLGIRLHTVVGIQRERGDKILSAGGPFFGFCPLYLFWFFFLWVKGKEKKKKEKKDCLELAVLKHCVKHIRTLPSSVISQACLWCWVIRLKSVTLTWSNEQLLPWGKIMSWWNCSLK